MTRRVIGRWRLWDSSGGEAAEGTGAGTPANDFVGNSPMMDNKMNEAGQWLSPVCIVAPAPLIILNKSKNFMVLSLGYLLIEIGANSGRQCRTASDHSLSPFLDADAFYCLTLTKARQLESMNHVLALVAFKMYLFPCFVVQSCL